MTIDNGLRIKRIKRMFYLVCVLLVASGAFMLFTDQTGRALIAGGVLIAWFLLFQAVDFQYIHFSVEDGKLMLRFYPAVRFGRKAYQTIEFPAGILHSYTIEGSFFGLVNDLTLLVKTKRGIAEYPSVSMAALSKSDQEKIRQTLHRLITPS